MLRSGTTHMVAFRQPYMSNPNLAERFINDWPLNPDIEYEDWWQVGHGAKGYTDWPFYVDESKEEDQREVLKLVESRGRRIIFTLCIHYILYRHQNVGAAVLFVHK